MLSGYALFVLSQPKQPQPWRDSREDLTNWFTISPRRETENHWKESDVQEPVVCEEAFSLQSGPREEEAAVPLLKPEEELK